MSSDDDRTPQDRLGKDLVSQPPPVTPSAGEQTVDPHATRPSAVAPDATDSIDAAALGSSCEVSADPHADAAHETVVSADAEASRADLETDQFVSSELGSKAQLDSEETTRFGPEVAAKQAARQFRRAKQTKWNQIGRYRVERELGAGAFGKVFLGRDKHLDRLVAVKVAKAGAIHTDEDKHRFLREARTAAQLRHPHIVPVYEYGEHEDTNYIAYEFIPGTTLRHVLRQRPKMSSREAADLMIKIGSALHYAHEHGVVHRDVKPENILIDDANQPHVADFGCARQDDTNVLLTMEGAVMGTPAYMSPEQASGASHRADSRSDVWSLGVILNELLTGQRPFKGNITEILLSIRSREPRPIRQLDSTLPRDLETIVQKCMAKEPNERFQTAGELVEELQRWERGEPIKSRPINLFARTLRWAKRNPQVAALVSLVLVTMALGAGFSTWFALNLVQQQNKNALQVADGLQDAEPGLVPSMVSSLNQVSNRQQVIDRLQERWQNEARSRGRLGLALVALEPHRFRDEILPELNEQLLSQEPEEFRALRDGLASEAAWFTRESGGLWEVAENVNELESRRIRAHAALAKYDPQADRWPDRAEDIVELVLSDEYRIAWLDALAPVREHLRIPLRRRFQSKRDAQAIAAAAIAQLFADDGALLAQLTRIATPAQLEHLLTPLNKEALPQIDAQLRGLAVPAATAAGEYDEVLRTVAAGTANLLIAKFKLGQVDAFFLEIGQELRPDVRTEIIERLVYARIDPQLMKRSISELQGDQQVAQLMAMLLSLGEFPLTPQRATLLKPQVLSIYRQHDDPGVHSAAEWLLHIWGFDSDLATESLNLVDRSSPSSGWRVLPTGQTMVALGPVDSFKMGSTAMEHKRFQLSEINGEIRHRRRISRRFEIATREVTAGEFAQFLRSAIKMLQDRRTKLAADDATSEDLLVAAERYERLLGRVTDLSAQYPVTEIKWSDAIAYCRWLGEENGIEDEEQCFRSLVELALQEPFAKPDDDRNAVLKTGFRLPTTGEWEYACRARAETAWPQGDSSEHLAAYAWVGQPEGSTTRRPATLKPNRFGLYDMLGNVSEWCHCLYGDYPRGDEVISDPYWEGNLREREYRGGNFETLAGQARPAKRAGQWADDVVRLRGFRVARTIEVVNE